MTGTFLIGLPKELSALPPVLHVNSVVKIGGHFCHGLWEGGCGRIQGLTVYPLHLDLIIESVKLCIFKGASLTKRLRVTIFCYRLRKIPLKRVIL